MIVNAAKRELKASRVFISPPSTATGKTGISAKTTHPTISLSGVATSVGSDGFSVKTTTSTVQVKATSSTLSFETGANTPSFASIKPGLVVGVAGFLDSASTTTTELIDASGIYITPKSPTEPIPPSSTVPRGTIDRELAPGGTVSSLTSTSFVYTNGSTTVKVILASWTTYYLNGSPTTISSLSKPGVTVGTAGVADPSSTSAAKVIDATKVYIASS